MRACAENLTSLPVRFWTGLRYSNYVIVYDPESKPLNIIRILHGGRNASEHLKMP
jgi:plasmid stabilization system protein ParE